MSIAGEVEVEVVQFDGEPRSEVIYGNEFGLEEGGDWIRDTDDGEWKAGCLFIAFRDGFDLLLHFGVHGSQMTRDDLSVRITDRERVRIVSIERDDLELSGFNPPANDDV
jgi:hypothetical protein